MNYTRKFSFIIADCHGKSKDILASH